MGSIRARTVCLLLALAAAGGCGTFQKKAPEKAADELAQAQSKMAADDAAGAAALLEQYVRANPKSEYRTDAWLLLGDCRLKLKDYPGAQTAYQEAQKDSRTLAVSANARVGLGTSMMHQKRYAEAAQAYESALSVSERDVAAPTVRWYMARAYIRSGNWTLGRDRLKKLVRKYPKSPEAPAARDILADPSDTFSVQVGAFSTREAADGLLEKLKQNGFFGGRVVQRPDGAAPPFTVRVGTYVTYDTALRQSERLRTLEPNNFVIP